MAGTWEPCLFCGHMPDDKHALNQQDHFPLPRRRNGTKLIPLCPSCHQAKDAGLHWEEKRYLAGGALPESIKKCIDMEFTDLEPFANWHALIPCGGETAAELECYKTLEEATEGFFDMIKKPGITKAVRILGARALALEASCGPVFGAYWNRE